MPNWLESNWSRIKVDSLINIILIVMVILLLIMIYIFAMYTLRAKAFMRKYGINPNDKKALDLVRDKHSELTKATYGDNLSKESLDALYRFERDTRAVGLEIDKHNLTLI